MNMSWKNILYAQPAQLCTFKTYIKMRHAECLLKNCLRMLNVRTKCLSMLIVGALSDAHKSHNFSKILKHTVQYTVHPPPKSKNFFNRFGVLKMGYKPIINNFNVWPFLPPPKIFAHAQHVTDNSNLRRANFEIITKTKSFWLFYYSQESRLPMEAFWYKIIRIQ